MQQAKNNKEAKKAAQEAFIGIMSGTSMDAADAVLAVWDADNPNTSPRSARIVGQASIPIEAHLRQELLQLAEGCTNEIHRAMQAANHISTWYAQATAAVLEKTRWQAQHICAIGAHGQTIRHQPQAGYSLQIINAALLAELCGIPVVADFRSRDVAAGGEGAPLVPLFHQELLKQHSTQNTSAAIAAYPDTAFLNIGGIANLSLLHQDGRLQGFDTGPGNVLLDSWIWRHQQRTFDADGSWGQGGQILPQLLEVLLSEAYFALPIPKSTGRELFSPAWLDNQLANTRWQSAKPVDIQATLSAFTAESIAQSLKKHFPNCQQIVVCGGGAFNLHLMACLRAALQRHAPKVALLSSQHFGVGELQMEALCFAWLARKHWLGEKLDASGVTGSKGPRMFGAWYPA